MVFLHDNWRNTLAVPVRDSVTVHGNYNEDNLSLTFSVNRKILLQGQEDFKEAANCKIRNKSK